MSLYLKIENVFISETYVFDSLSNINTTKACGPDLVSPRVLKEAAKELAKPLSNLYNLSVQSSYFPANWKMANVIQCFKKGDKSQVSNYLPISLISCIGKTFERCVFKHLYNYLNSNDLLTCLQSGFRQSDSPAFQLIDMIKKMSKQLTTVRKLE